MYVGTQQCWNLLRNVLSMNPPAPNQIWSNTTFTLIWALTDLAFLTMDIVTTQSESFIFFIFSFFFIA